jgi:hypothetical protein
MCEHHYSPTLDAGKQENSAHQKFLSNAGKTQSSDEESGIAMRRENAKMFGFQPIGVFL